MARKFIKLVLVSVLLITLTTSNSYAIGASIVMNPLQLAQTVLQVAQDKTKYVQDKLHDVFMESKVVKELAVLTKTYDNVFKTYQEAHDHIQQIGTFAFTIKDIASTHGRSLLQCYPNPLDAWNWSSISTAPTPCSIKNFLDQEFAIYNEKVQTSALIQDLDSYFNGKNVSRETSIILHKKSNHIKLNSSEALYVHNAKLYMKTIINKSLDTSISTNQSQAPIILKDLKDISQKAVTSVSGETQTEMLRQILRTAKLNLQVNIQNAKVNTFRLQLETSKALEDKKISLKNILCVREKAGHISNLCKQPEK